MVKVVDSQFVDTQLISSKIIGVDWTMAGWDRNDAFQIHQPIRFYDCILNYSVFIGLQLDNLQLEKCIAREVDFSDAGLKKAAFCATDLENAIFRNTDLSESNFVGALNYAISPQLNKLKGAKFSLPEAVSLLYGLDIIIEDGYSTQIDAGEEINR